MRQDDKQGSLAGPILALDLGEKRVGMAISDELLISIRRLAPVARSNWKQLLRDVADTVQTCDAKALVIGLPLGLNGNHGPAAKSVEQIAGKFAQSLTIPVFLQDERLTSVAAAEQLRDAGHSSKEAKNLLDSQAAAIILGDFIGAEQNRTEVKAKDTPNV